MTTANQTRSYTVEERATVSRIIERLVQRFPECPVEEIVAIDSHRELRDSRIRGFVAILVEHLAQEDLKNPSGRKRSSQDQSCD